MLDWLKKVSKVAHYGQITISQFTNEYEYIIDCIKNLAVSSLCDWKTIQIWIYTSSICQSTKQSQKQK